MKFVLELWPDIDDVTPQQALAFAVATVNANPDLAWDVQTDDGTVHTGVKLPPSTDPTDGATGCVMPAETASPVLVYISQEGGEIEDIQDLIDGKESELAWVGTRHGADIPLVVRIGADPDDNDDNENLDGATG